MFGGGASSGFGGFGSSTTTNNSPFGGGAGAGAATTNTGASPFGSTNTNTTGGGIFGSNANSSTGFVHPMHLVLALIQILHRHLEVILEVDSLVPRPTGPVHLRLVSNNNNNNNNHSKLHLRLGLPTIQDLFWVISYWRWFIW